MRSGAKDTISFDANSSVCRIADVSKSIELSQSTEGIVPSITKGPVPNSLSARCGNSYDKVVPSPISLPTTSQNEYVGTTIELPALQVSKCATYLSHHVDIFKGFHHGAQIHQMQSYPDVNTGAPSWL